MYRQIIFLIFILVFVFISTANAKTIIWVSGNVDGDNNADLTNDWQEWIDKLESEGYTVDARPQYWDELTQAKVDELNAADLVITQAGHSTAMELLTLGKPSIVIPDLKQIEQENNALRMEELKTSIKLEYGEFSPEKLAETIKRATEEPILFENTKKFKIMAGEIQGSKKAADLIKDYSKRLQYY